MAVKRERFGLITDKSPYRFFNTEQSVLDKYVFNNNKWTQRVVIIFTYMSIYNNTSVYWFI